MKMRFWQTLILAAATSPALLPILARATFADDPKPAPDVPAVINAPATTPPANPPALPTTPAPAATNAAAATVLQWPKLSLPPLLDQVVRLSQSGADEQVLRAYIDKAAPPYRITGHEIIELRNLGVSQNVILALIDHSKSAGPGNAAPAVTEPSAPVLPPTPPPATNAAVTSPATEAVADFRDSLAPYGTWMNLPEYGWCWQPTVVVVNPGWQPYCDYGGWLWSDNGWYWNSYYSWGWAAFHYGRWCSYPNTGWVWCPGQTWGPAWVCWQNSPGYCAWAPLPPNCNYAAGVGWTWHGQPVNANCGFGVGTASYTVVAHNNFAARNVGAHSLRGPQAASALNQATMINNYAVGANNRLVNRGVGRETIAAASRTPVREVTVREVPQSGNHSTVPSALPGRVSQAGGSAVVYRPGAQISAPRTTVVQNSPGRATVARPATTSVMTVNQRAAPGQSSAPRAAVATGTTAPRVTSGSPRSYANAGQAQRVYPGGNATAAPRSSSPVYARPSAPLSSAPRAVGAPAGVSRAAAPSTVGRTMASSGGGYSGGSISRSAAPSTPSSGARR